MHSFSTQVTVHAISIKIYQLVVYSLTCKLNNALSSHGTEFYEVDEFYGVKHRGVENDNLRMFLTT